MGSKVMLLFSICLIASLLILPQVAARNLAQTSTYKPKVAAKNTKGTNDAKYGYGDPGNSIPSYGNPGNSAPGYGNPGNSAPGYGNPGNGGYPGPGH